MIRRSPIHLLGAAGAAAVFLAIGSLQAAEVPPAPALSTLVPVEDLVGQVEHYLEEIEECVEDQDTYDDSVEKLQRCAHSLTVIALSIGLHDQNSPLKKASPLIVRASQQLAAAKDLAGAKSGITAVKAALSGAGDPTTLRWSKVADMPALMKQVPLINTRMKRYMRRLDKGASILAGDSAAVVAISQASLANAGDTDAPDKVAEWYNYCIQMRDAAAALNQAVHAKNEAAATSAMAALQKSCDDCHAIFHPDVKVE